MPPPTGSRSRVDITAILALLVALASLVFAIFQHRENVRLTKQISLDTGELYVHRPTEFCIARGYQWFPSDHLIVPIVLENTGSGAKIFERPALFFTDPILNEPITFFMEGYILGLDLDIYRQEFEVARGIAVPERSLSRYVLVFHVEDWWNEESDRFRYHFQQVDGMPDLVDVHMGYFESNGDEPIYWDENGDEVYFTMPLYKTINSLGMNPELVEYLQEYDLYDGLEDIGSSYYDIDCFELADFPDRPTGF